MGLAANPGQGCKECEIPSWRGGRGRRGKEWKSKTRLPKTRHGRGAKLWRLEAGGSGSPSPLPSMVLRMFPSSLSSPSIIAHLNTTLSHVPSSPSSRQARPRPAFFKASLLQWTAPITHPPSPLSHLPSPPYCCSLPPFFIFTSILNLDLQNLEPPPQSPWGITSSLPTPSFWWEPAQAQYAPPWKRSELSVPQRGWS